MTTTSVARNETAADPVYRKITWRLAPILFICYTLNYIDRVNIGYAQLQMKQALQFTDAIYGLGASAFFVGYFLFEVPSNLMLQKIGARLTILRIMFLWGLVSALTMFVSTPTEFYAARFFLGVFEAGLFPGIILYLTYWYPAARRARVVALFMVATVAAGLIGGPTSGWIIQNMNGVYGYQGWQWMFLLEGLPSSLMGIVAFLVLSERPGDARWLTDSEKTLVAGDLAADATLQAASGARPSRSPFLDPQVYLLSFVLFCMLCGSYAIAFWLPTMIRELGVKSIQDIGLYATIPDFAAAFATILYSRHSDATRERRWHFAVVAILAALGLCAITFLGHSLALSLAAIALVRASIVSSLPVFWALSTSLLTARASVAGIAVIASLSNLSGVVSPAALGFIKTATGSLANGFYAIAALTVLAALLVLSMVPREPKAATTRYGAAQPASAA